MPAPVSLAESSIMAACGPLVPVILPEAMDEGASRLRSVRDSISTRFPEYTPTALRSMLVSHMYHAMADLVLAADPEGQHLRVRETQNRAAWELYVGSFLYIKLKRVSDDLGSQDPDEDDDLAELGDIADEPIVRYGQPRNNPTARTRLQRAPRQVLRHQQLILPNITPVQVDDDGKGRICAMAEFDQTAFEDDVARHRLTLYDGKFALWRHFLTARSVANIARISRPLAERVDEFRRARTA